MIPPEMEPGVPDEPDLLAAEYVLGAMPADERIGFEQRLRDDPALAAQVAAWEDRLAPLAELVPAASPPPELWQRLALASGTAVPVRHRQVRQMRSAGSQRTVRFWRSATAASLMLAAAALAYAIVPGTQAGEPMLAALSPAGAPGAVFLVRVDSSGTATMITTVKPTVPAGRSLQLWAVAEGAVAPTSLGLLNPAGAMSLRIRSAPGTRLLVTLEPTGGSTTGKPTGPVVFAGLLSSGT